MLMHYFEHLLQIFHTSFVPGPIVFDRCKGGLINTRPNNEKAFFIFLALFLNIVRRQIYILYRCSDLHPYQLTTSPIVSWLLSNVCPSRKFFTVKEQNVVAGC